MDIRKRQLRDVLDEDMNVQKRVMRTQVKVQQVTPSGIRARVPLEARTKYNLSLLFNKFRLELEDTIDTYNEGLNVDAFGELIQQYNQIVAYIQAYGRQNELSTQDREYIEKSFEDLLPYVETVGQIASTGNSIDKADVAELVNRYRSKDRSPVVISESLVRGRQQGYNVIAPQDQIYEQQKQRFVAIFDRIDNSPALTPQQRKQLADTFGDMYVKYGDAMGDYFSNARNPNSPRFRSARAKMEQLSEELDDFVNDLNANGII
jgi:hypothetical protein